MRKIEINKIILPSQFERFWAIGESEYEESYFVHIDVALYRLRFYGMFQ
jgi:hypothetical protein